MECIKVYTILCIFNVAVSGKFLETNESEENNLSDILIDAILNNNPHESRNSILLYGYHSHTVYKKLIESGASLVVMNSNPKHSNDFEIPVPRFGMENYVQQRIGIMMIYGNNFKDVEKALLDISQSIYWASDAKTIVYLKKTENIHLLFYWFWWYNIFNCVIFEVDKKKLYVNKYSSFVTFDAENKNQYGCWSTLPHDFYQDDTKDSFFCNQSCSFMANDDDNIHFFKACINIERSEFDTNIELFPDKTKNMNGYPLAVLAMHTPPSLNFDNWKKGPDKISGTDANAIKVLADKMNFTLRFKKSLKLINDDPGYDTYSFGYVALGSRRYDISANNMFLTAMPFIKIDFIYPISGSGLCFIVHRSDPLPAWLKLSVVFEVNTILLLVVAYNFVIYLAYEYVKRSRKTSLLDSIGISFVYTTQLFLSLPVPKTGKTARYRLFFITMYWCLFTVNFLFQVSIISILTVPRYRNNINTFEDLYRSGYLIEGLPSPDTFLPSTSYIYEALNDRFVSKTDLSECAEDLKKVKDKACWMECNRAYEIQQTFRDEQGRLVVHVGKDRVHNMYSVYPIPKDSPLIKNFNHYTKMIFESGLVKHWRESAFIIKSDFDSNVKVLQMSDLQGCFFILGFCHCLAVLSYIVEIFLYYKHHLFIIFKCCLDNISDRFKYPYNN